MVIMEESIGHKIGNDKPNISAIVTMLKNDSGLTIDQIGRALGVSKRSVYNWSKGATVSPLKEARIRDLNNLVFSLDADSPSERRRLLLNSSHGPSIYKKFLDSGKKNQQIQYSVPVREIFGL